MSSSVPGRRDVMVVGSCSVDYTSYADRLPTPGETILGYKFTTSFGGKGANQCVAASNFGGNVSLYAKVGSDQWGSDYIKSLESLGVNTSRIHRSKEAPTGTALINVSRSGENQIVVIPGANNELLMTRYGLPGTGVLICQLETPIEQTLKAFQYYTGIKILNAAPAIKNLDKELLSLTTVLCVNETEAEIITGKAIDALGLAGMLKELLSTGCETAVITLGSRGAAFARKDEPEGYHIESEKVTPVDTTGAGDAFVGALGTLLSYEEDFPWIQMIGAACKVATMSVMSEGTQTSYPKIDIRLFLKYNYSSHKLTL